MSLPYRQLDKAFTAPSIINPAFKGVKRVPRKFKKKWKHVLQAERYAHLELGQKLWYIRWFTNPDYNRFLIKKISEQ